MHMWDDESFDWESLYQAEEYINRQCRRWARLGLHTKEKFGTLRVSTTCAFWGQWPIHNLVKPGHVSYRWPKWVMLYVEKPLRKMFELLYITRIVNFYQVKVLGYFWRRAAKKWPHVAKEILADYRWTMKT